LKVKIHIDETISQSTNNLRLVEVDGNTVGECLNGLIELFPGINKWIFGDHGLLLAVVSVNSEIVYQESLNRPVREGDNVALFYMIGGG
jgi:molybdopterin converting factor small subunit